MGLDCVPLINLFLSRISRDAVPLLNLSDQLIVLSVDHINVIIGQLGYITRLENEMIYSRAANFRLRVRWSCRCAGITNHLKSA